MEQPEHVAVGTWSGGRFMRFGEDVGDERLERILTPGDGIHTLLTADTYGRGRPTAARRSAHRTPRATTSSSPAPWPRLLRGEREGAKGFPRFTDPRLRGPDDYGATSRRPRARAWSA